MSIGLKGLYARGVGITNAAEVGLFARGFWPNASGGGAGSPLHRYTRWGLMVAFLIPLTLVGCG